MESASILLIGAKGTHDKPPFVSLSRRYDVISAYNGKQGVSLAHKLSPQIIILNAASMRTTGLRICQQLKDTAEQSSIIHIYPLPRCKVDTAADVLLFPPFTVRKLTNNIKRLLDAPTDKTIECGPFALNVTSRILTAHGHEVPLTPKQTALVKAFLQRPGETIDRKTLMQNVWDTHYVGDTRTLDVHIRWVRNAIEQGNGKPRYLKTVRGVGYRLEIPD